MTERRQKSTGIAHDYPSLIEALRARCRALKLTYLDLEVDAELPDGYARKIFDTQSHMTPATFSKLLRALEVRLIVEPLPAMAKDWPRPSPFAPIEALDKKTLRKMWGSWGGKKRALKLSAKRRREIAQIGAWERWRARSSAE